MKNLFAYELFHIDGFSLTVGNIAVAIFVIIVNIFITRAIAFAITKSFKKRGDEHGRHYAIIRLIKYIFWTLAIVMAIQALGINITILLASSAALLVGLGLGMQNIFKDFTSGILLLVEGTIRVNDIIEVQGEVLQVKKYHGVHRK